MKQEKKLPRAAVVILAVIIGASIFAGVLAPYAPGEMDPDAVSSLPDAVHPFGTDAMGRDLLSMILYGGRSSIYIGLISGLISTGIAVIYGTVSGLVREWAGDLLMRFSELLMSLPSLLLILFLQALWGKPSETSLAVIIGLTGWMSISKIVRGEVRQIRNSDYLLAARTMEAGFWYLFRRHMLPNLISSVMFMAVTKIGQAMITEATLSFLGLGLPLNQVSWGSLMSMSEEALLSGSWHLIVIPGTVLIITLVCITEIGEYVRKKNNRLYSNL